MQHLDDYTKAVGKLAALRDQQLDNLLKAYRDLAKTVLEEYQKDVEALRAHFMVTASVVSSSVVSPLPPISPTTPHVPPVSPTIPHVPPATTSDPSEVSMLVHSKESHDSIEVYRDFKRFDAMVIVKAFGLKNFELIFSSRTGYIAARAGIDTPHYTIIG